jgi:hypothetical protein
MKNKLAYIVPLTVVGLLSLPAHAIITTIDFEDIGVAAGTDLIGGDLTSNGYLFNSRPNHSHLVNNNYLSYNDSTWVGFDDVEGNHNVLMTQVGGGVFNLISVDFSEFINLNTANLIRVRGSGGEDINVNLDNIADGAGQLDDFQTEVFNWSDLNWVRFNARGTAGESWWAFDNIVVSVPEPATLGILGLSLLGLGLSGRRKAS